MRRMRRHELRRAIGEVAKRTDAECPLTADMIREWLGVALTDDALNAALYRETKRGVLRRIALGEYVAAEAKS